MRFNCVILSVCCGLAVASAASADNLVFQSNSDLGFFTPITSANANTGIRYGDSGWVLGPGQPPIQLSKVVLNLATFGASAGAGSTDIKFTLSDGDPSGLVFGSAATLYQTTLTNVTLPATFGSAPTYFDLEIPLPSGTFSLGGFNNLGFSIETSNFSYSGQFGFQVGVSSGPGFITNNASFYNGSSWSLFSFNPNPAQFAFQVYEVPAPGSAALLGVGGLMVARRRRR